MQIKHTTALVTGANRSVGKVCVADLLRRGVAKVHASARATSAADG